MCTFYWFCFSLRVLSPFFLIVNLHFWNYYVPSHAYSRDTPFNHLDSTSSESTFHRILAHNYHLSLFTDRAAPPPPSPPPPLTSLRGYHSPIFSSGPTTTTTLTWRGEDAPAIPDRERQKWEEDLATSSIIQSSWPQQLIRRSNTPPTDPWEPWTCYGTVRIIRQPDTDQSIGRQPKPYGVIRRQEFWPIRSPYWQGRDVIYWWRLNWRRGRACTYIRARS